MIARIIRILRKSWIYIVGIMAVVWFLIRVIPKPSRAAYPCQRAAFPVASAFMIWLTGTLFTAKLMRNAVQILRENRVISALGLTLAGAGLFLLSNMIFPAGDVEAGTSAAKDAVPELALRYTPGADPLLDPVSTVSLIDAGMDNVFDIDRDMVEQMVRQAVAMAGGLEDIVSDGNTVVLKPNIVVDNFLGQPVSPEANGMLTDWRVVAAVARLVREVNPSGKILVMEGSAAESTSAAYEKLKYTKESIPEVNEFLAIEETSGGWREYQSDKLRTFLLPADDVLYPDFRLPNGTASYFYNRRYFDADVIISLPVLKNHETAGFTGAVKNMGIGGTPSNIYGNSETDNGRWNTISHTAAMLHRFIHDFYMGRPAQFAVMDGIQGYSNGPNFNYGPRYISGHQEGMGLILASRDPVALDAIASLIMFDDPSRVPHLVYLNNSDVGCADPVAIRVAGALVSDVKKPFAHESHLTDCDYSDNQPPAAYIEDMDITGHLLQMDLGNTGDLARLDVTVDGQEYPRFVIGDFDHIEIDLDQFELTDTLITLYAHDRYMNTKTFYVKGAQGLTGNREYTVRAEGICLYPNPVSTYLMIELNGRYEGRASCNLYSLTGQLVLSRHEYLRAGNHTLMMDLSGVEPGNYFLVISVGGKKISAPLIKQ